MSSAGRSLRPKVYVSIFQIQLAQQLQYRASAAAGAMTSVFCAIIEITVYTLFFTHSTYGGSVGMTLPQVVTYCWLAQFAFLLQPMQVEPELLRKIKNGDMGVELCRPLGLYGHWFAKSAGSTLARTVLRGGFVLLAGALIPGSYRMGAPDSAAGLLMTLLALGCAFLLCTSYGMLMAAVRMNIPWGDGPVYMLMLIPGVLSGTYLPLQLWPDSMQTFLMLQPFAGYADLPLRLYVGTLSPLGGIGAVGLQLGWTALFVLLGRALMAKRLREVVIQDG